jgi:hypothetical protein
MSQSWGKVLKIFVEPAAGQGLTNGSRTLDAEVSRNPRGRWIFAGP